MVFNLFLGSVVYRTSHPGEVRGKIFRSGVRHRSKWADLNNLQLEQWATAAQLDEQRVSSVDPTEDF